MRWWGDKVSVWKNAEPGAAPPQTMGIHYRSPAAAPDRLAPGAEPLHRAAFVPLITHPPPQPPRPAGKMLPGVLLANAPFWCPMPTDFSHDLLIPASPFTPLASGTHFKRLNCPCQGGAWCQAALGPYGPGQVDKPPPC